MQINTKKSDQSLDDAIQANNLPQVLEIISYPEKSATLDQVLRIAVLNSKIEPYKNAISYLLKKGADPNALSICTDIEIAQLLLSHGADINKKDKNGDSFLLEAILSGNSKLLEFALANGADPSLTEEDRKRIQAYLESSLLNSVGFAPVLKDIKRNFLLLVPEFLKRHQQDNFIFALRYLPVAELNIDLEHWTDNEESQCLHYLLELMDRDARPDWLTPEKIVPLKIFTRQLIEEYIPNFLNGIENSVDNEIDIKIACLSYDSISRLISLLKSSVLLERAGILEDSIGEKITYLYEKNKSLIQRFENNLIPSNTIQLSDSIEEHAKYLFQHVYSIPYPYTGYNDGIARGYHGIMHTSRAAIYVPVFANLYKKYDDPEMVLLSDEDIKLIQIAVLLHDAGREAEGVDHWDIESAEMVFQYLKKLNVPENKAILLAEAVANKDAETNNEGETCYYKLNITPNQHIWKPVDVTPPKNIYQKIVHDADCLDIIRVREVYKGEELDFYKSIAKNNAAALNEQAQLITEARSLIERQGDSYKRVKPDIKRIYESEDGLKFTLKNIIKKESFPILSDLYTPNGLLTTDALEKMTLVENTAFDPKNGLTESNLKAAMREGKLFARGIAVPSAICEKTHKTQDGESITETLVDVDMRKTDRRTTTKEGNPDRSISMLSYGAGVFANAGFLLVNPNHDAITSIAKTNSGTGFGKNKHIFAPITTLDEKEKALQKLLLRLKLGGKSKTINNYPASHVEITSLIKNYDAIFYSNDPALSNIYSHDTPEPVHPLSPFLQAVYLQKEYEVKHKIKLPIFEYSGLHNFIREVKEEEYHDDVLICSWANMCGDFVSRKFAHEDALSMCKKLETLSKDALKIDAMYGNERKHFLSEKFNPADHNYPEELQQRIGEAIQARLDALVVEKLSNVVDTIAEAVTIYTNIPYLNQQKELKWLQALIMNESMLASFMEKLTIWERTNFIKNVDRKWLNKTINGNPDKFFSRYLTNTQLMVLFCDKEADLLNAVEEQDIEKVMLNTLHNQVNTSNIPPQSAKRTLMSDLGMFSNAQTNENLSSQPAAYPNKKLKLS